MTRLLPKSSFFVTVESVVVERFAHGLHEVLSLAEKDGWLYLTQRSDVSRIKEF